MSHPTDGYSPGVLTYHVNASNGTSEEGIWPDGLNFSFWIHQANESEAAEFFEPALVAFAQAWESAHPTHSVQVGKSYQGGRSGDPVYPPIS